MSGVAIAWYLLKTNAALIAVVPAAKIFSGVVPLGTPMPALSVMEISGVPRLTVGMNETHPQVTERVQVTAMAATYPAVKSILTLVRNALPVSRGTVNGFDCDSITPDLEGPDMPDVDSGIYLQTQDFLVRFNR